MIINTFGSICSEIEATSLGFKGLDFKWLSEISEFPSQLLKIKYPNTINLGDFTKISNKILNLEIEAPDFICGGTPCQAFSLNKIIRS